MKNKVKQLSLLLVPALLWVFAACGQKPVTMADIPVFPGASAISSSDSLVDAALKNNIESDAVMRKALEPVAAGGSLEETGYSVPAGTAWQDILDFYEENLPASGWSSGLTRLPKNISGMSPILGASDDTGQLFHSTLYIKGDQNLAIILVTLPADEENPEEQELRLYLASK